MFTPRGREGANVCHLKHCGARIGQYLKSGALRPHGLLTRAHRGKVYNKHGTRVKLTYIPFPGDVILLEW